MARGVLVFTGMEEKKSLCFADLYLCCDSGVKTLHWWLARSETANYNMLTRVVICLLVLNCKTFLQNVQKALGEIKYPFSSFHMGVILGHSLQIHNTGSAQTSQK